MGQKVHPYGFRLGITKNWRSRWFSLKDYAELIQEDRRIRALVKKNLASAGVSDVEVERKSKQIEITIYTAKPGMVVGRSGQNIEKLRQQIFKEMNQKVQMNVQEIKHVERNAQLIAEAASLQLEKRVAFRRVMKQAMMRAMQAGAKGIKIMVAGRLGGTEIARTEWLREGRIPLHTLRADIDYGFYEAKTVFGIIGIKVWVFNGEILSAKNANTNAVPAKEDKTNVNA